MPSTILMQVHVLNTVQTKHGGEFGQKAVQKRNKSETPASNSSLMDAAKHTRHQDVILNELNCRTWWQRCALALAEGGGHAVAPTVGLAVMAPVSCAQMC